MPIISFISLHVTDGFTFIWHDETTQCWFENVVCLVFLIQEQIEQFLGGFFNFRTIVVKIFGYAKLEGVKGM